MFLASIIISYLATLSACPGQASKGDSQPAAGASQKPWPQMPQTQAEGIQKGRALFNQTALHLGPDQSTSALKLAGNRLNCSSCHLNEGKLHNALSLIGVSQRYPAYYAPLDQQLTLSQRIDACFQRSLNGKPLSQTSLKAFVTYLDWLSTDVPAEIASSAQKLPEFNLPTRASNLDSGRQLYTYHCAACHGAQGQGVAKDERNLSQGYTFPPLWGEDSFSKSSSLARLSLLTKYIKGAMPLNRPVLRPDEAYDVAGYILAQQRPELALQTTDYPNLKTKPFDVLFGPFSDSMPLMQHQLGPLPANP